jgi:hypothetical protein
VLRRELCVLSGAEIRIPSLKRSAHLRRKRQARPFCSARCTAFVTAPFDIPVAAAIFS